MNKLNNNPSVEGQGYYGENLVTFKGDGSDKITDFMGIDKNGKWFVKNWDQIADTIIAHKRIAIYNGTVTIQWDKDKWVTVDCKDEDIIRRYIAQQRLNLNPSMINSISKHTASMIEMVNVETNDNIIYFSNGDYDIRTGVFTEIDNPPYNHRRLNRPYIPFNKCKASAKVMQFLAQFKDHEDHMIGRQIAEMIGAVLVPTKKFRKMFQLYGNGFNGKSEIMNITSNAIGKEKTSTVDIEALTSGRAFALLPLVNKTMNLVDELETMKGNGVAKLKIAASGGSMSAEIKGGRSFTFDNEATVVFGANFHLDATDGSFSIGDRLQIINFTKRFRTKDGKDIVELMDREEYMNEEFYIAWLALGAQAAHALHVNKGKFTVDQNSIDLEEERKKQACTVYEWLHEGDGLDLFNHNGIAKSEIYTKYTEWTSANGRRPIALNRMGGRLEMYIENLDVNSKKMDPTTKKRVNIYRVKDVENE